jgi:hypothetical protein
MKTIELETFNPVVFDDQEYCHSNIDKCSHMSGGLFMAECSLFAPGNKKTKLKASTIVTFFKKCQQCKDHYQRNKK